jgi:hypothetical protein
MSPTSPTYDDDFVEESAIDGSSPFLTATANQDIGNARKEGSDGGVSKFVFVYQPLAETSPGRYLLILMKCDISHSFG